MSHYDDGMVSLEQILILQHHIPKYQRNYDWAEKECSELMSDLIRFHENKRENSKYLFGQVISYIGDHKNLYLLDGQQRLTSVSLFIMAFYNISDIISENPIHHDNAEAYKSEAMQKIARIRSGKKEFNLHVYNQNVEIFQGIFQGKLGKPETISQRNMINNYQYFFHRLCGYIGVFENEYGDIDKEELINISSDSYEKLFELFETLMSFRVAAIYCDYLSEAYEIFETINNRGIPLKQLDLLKNHIFCKCYETDDDLLNDDFEIEKQWDIIKSGLEALKDLKDSESASLRLYVRATTETTRNDVYQALIDRIRSPGDAKLFLKEFQRAITFFRIAFTPYQEDVPDKIKQKFRYLQKFGFKSYIPAALSVYLRDKDSPDLMKNLERILNIYDRFYVLNIFPNIAKANSLEDSTSKIAIKYYSGMATLEDIENEVNEKSSKNQDQIITALTILDCKSNSSITGVLAELYDRKHGGSIVDLAKVQLEHIMPSEWEKYWPELTSEVHERCSKKIGNMLLLNNKMNGKIQNREFEYKKNHYVNANGELQFSDIRGEWILDSDAWNEERIKNRTDFLAKSIVETWF